MKLPNCTEDDVRDIIATGLDTTQIARLITRADAEMTARGIVASAVYTAELLKDISAFLTAHRASLNDVGTHGKNDYVGRDMPKYYREQAEILINKASLPAIISYNEPLEDEDEDYWE